MRKKLKDLCASFPKVARLQSSMDNVGTEMFKPLRGGRYIQSSTPPERRYGIAVDQVSLKHHNIHLDDFHTTYGPNEQYLINKILYTPHNLIYVIGGIGVGKTTFTHFLITEVMSKLRHEVTHETSKCPCPIYFDFLQLGAATFEKSDFEKIQLTFSNLLCDQIESEIALKEHLNTEQEVGAVWETMISDDSSSYQRNAAVSFIISKLRNEEADGKALTREYEQTISKRKGIRGQIVADPTLRRFYLAALLKYIKLKYYSDHPGCFLIIVDNIDREPTAVQHAIKMVLKPFARASTIKVVVNARQTTFYQSLDDGMSEPLDQVAYCGAGPLDIVLARIDDFLENSEKYSAFYSPSALPALVKGMRELRDSFLKRDWFSSFFLSFTGRSIRKALILAQHLVDNSVYDPSEIGQSGRNSIRQNDVMRAIMVGANNTYSWSEAGLIDNLYDVHEKVDNAYLIKPRILRILSVREDVGLKVKPLHTILNALGYEAEVIIDALNELMPASKRMIWSDEVKRFDDVQDLVGHAHAHLFVTMIGKGYDRCLYKTLAYIQEVMLDTTVDSIEFGHGWDYGKMEDRLKLVSLFCAMLQECDFREVKLFVNSYGPESYRRDFGSSQLISKEILEAVNHEVQAILKFVSSQSQRYAHGTFADFLAEHSSFYQDRIVRAIRFEAEYLEA
jgi:hypothetical protein